MIRRVRRTAFGSGLARDPCRLGRREPDQVDAGELQVQPVGDARKVVLSGPARLVDTALRVFDALDLPGPEVPPPPEGPRPTIRIFRLQAAEPAEVAVSLQAAIAPSVSSAAPGRPVPPGVRGVPGGGGEGTRIVPDARSRTLIVRTTRPEDLETIDAILKEIDVPAPAPSHDK